MINNKAVGISISIAESFAEKGKQIVAKPNTLVAELNRLANASLFLSENQIENQGRENYSVLISKNTGGNIDSPSLHDAFMDSATADLNKYISAHISFAKNIVKPAVLDFYNNLKKFTQSYSNKKAETSIDLIEYDIPAIFLDETFTSTFSYVKGKPILKPDRTINFAAKNHDEILAMLVTGDKRYDEDILPWATKFNSELMEDIWLSFFTAVPIAASKKQLDFDFIKSLSSYRKLDIALLLYLLSNNLLNNPQSTVDNVDLPTYKNYIGQMKDFAIGLIWACLETFSLYAKNKTMVLNKDPYNKTIIVYKPVYNKWLETNGTPEVILGLFVNNRYLVLESAITEAAEELKKSWNSYCVYFNASEENKKLDYYRNYLKLNFSEILSKYFKDIEEYKNEHPGYDDVINKLLDDYIYKLSLSDLADLDKISLHCIAGCMFYYTGSYEILNGIEEAIKANPTINIREAALLSAITYVADFLSDQIAIS